MIKKILIKFKSPNKIILKKVSLDRYLLTKELNKAKKKIEPSELRNENSKEI